MKDEPIILAIETSQTGSVSLLKGIELIDFWVGDKENSRSQDLLPEISKLLEKNSVLKKDIDLIAVATGPGSFTGLRVGVSIAIGLSQALGCARIGVPTLSAMSMIEPGVNLICVVPAGREQSYWQAFEGKKQTTEIHLSSYPDFKAEAENRPDAKIIAESQSFEKIKDIAASVFAAPENLAYLIGIAALENISEASIKSDITPLYVRDASVRI